MKKMYKRIVSLLTASIILLLFTACTQKSDNSGADVGAIGSGTLFSEPTELSLITTSNASWPYDKDWVIWKYFEEKTGAKLKIQAIPSSELKTKIPLIMASRDTLPDLIYLTKNDADAHALSGALVAIDDYMEDMPNYKKVWDSVPEEERSAQLMQRISSDGKTYVPQIFGSGTIGNSRAWLYRKDIFEKHGLKPPETIDELYNVAVELKKLYPESYPLCLRTGLQNLSIIGPQWKPYFSYKVYYDFDNDYWGYGASEDTMKDIVEYFRKLHSESLIPPDFLTINAKSWQELISTGRGFIMPEYLVRIDFFNLPARSENPEFTLAATIPPKADTAGGQNKIARMDSVLTGYAVCNTGDEKRIKNAIKFIDWMYSDDALEILNWGKEGETFRIEDGKKQYILEGDERATTKYGISTSGTSLRNDPDVSRAIMSEEQYNSAEFVFEHTETIINPTVWLALNPDEIRVRETIGVEIDTYVEEMLSKFLLNQEPMSKWDAFRASINDMGLDELLAAYRSAFDRVRDSLKK